MAAHRYWRLLFRSSANTTVGIGEVQMRTSIGGVNVATGGTASASNSYDANYLPAKAFDGKTIDTGAGNGWNSSNFIGTDGLASFPWLMYDFGAGNAQDIVEIVLFAPGTGGIGNVTQFPTAWHFQWSDDGVKWVTQRSYAFDSSTPAWAFATSRIYDVRTLGGIDIHNVVTMEYHGFRNPTPGSPSFPVYDPNSAAGKLTHNQLRFAYDGIRGGQYKLSGTTTSLGMPAPRRVRLYEQVGGRLHAEINTSQNGLFEFRNIHQGPWTVIGLDDTGAQNGVIFSHILAVPM